MKDFNGAHKASSFGGRSKFGAKSGARGGFGKPQRGGFSDRGGRDFERPTMHKAICSDCGNSCEVPFRPTGGKPVLCSSCFSMQKGGERKSFGDRGDRGDRGGRDFSAGADRKMFKATCEECGNTCEVPFRPMEGKPVFCSDCFHGSEQPSARKSFKSQDNSQELSALHVKLDQILVLLKNINLSGEKNEQKEEISSALKVAKKDLKGAVVAEKKIKKPVKAKEGNLKKVKAVKRKA